MIDALHEETDLRESLTERSQEVVDRVMRERMADAVEASMLDGSLDMAEVFTLLAEWVEEELADLTTEAVHGGAEAGRKIAASIK